MALFGRKQYSSVQVKKRDIPGGLWLKCPACNEVIYRNALKEGLSVCPKCDHHFPLKRMERLELLVDKDSFTEWDAELRSVDTLKFQGKESYIEKLEKNIEKTGYNDAILCGVGAIGGTRTAVGIMDFSFLGASMGAVVGEKVTRLFERALEQGLPVVLSSASGGARMYEGIFSLMQMAKTSAAIARHSKAGLPFISLLTHPTTAGVMASYASLGDVIIAEPRALIGFAGPRVIKETTQQDLPAGFQRSEFLLKHGLIDIVIHRRDLKERIAMLLDYMCAAKQSA
jgi:acetyl-CoA carboxylase carboxyl transferase subunit beta